MKRCPYCGAKYPSDATVCATDETALEDLDAPKPSEASPKPEVGDATFETGPDLRSNDGEAPDGFVCLGAFESFDADRILEQFVAANLRFQIDRVDRPIMIRGAYRNMGLIEIYIHKDDYDPAFKIMSADWKV